MALGWTANKLKPPTWLLWSVLLKGPLSHFPEQSNFPFLLSCFLTDKMSTSLEECSTEVFKPCQGETVLVFCPEKRNFLLGLIILLSTLGNIRCAASQSLEIQVTISRCKCQLQTASVQLKLLRLSEVKNCLKKAIFHMLFIIEKCN